MKCFLPAVFNGWNVWWNSGHYQHLLALRAVVHKGSIKWLPFWNMRCDCCECMHICCMHIIYTCVFGLNLQDWLGYSVTFEKSVLFCFMVLRQPCVIIRMLKLTTNQKSVYSCLNVGETACTWTFYVRTVVHTVFMYGQLYTQYLCTDSCTHTVSPSSGWTCKFIHKRGGNPSGLFVWITPSSVPHWQRTILFCF